MEQNAAVAADNLIIRLENDTDLRPVRPEDAEEFFAVVDRNRTSAPEAFLDRAGIFSIENMRSFLADHVAEFERRESLTMAIRRQEAICGAIGLHRIDHRHRSTSIGYWIDEAEQGNCYGGLHCNCDGRLPDFRTAQNRDLLRHDESSKQRHPRRLEFVEEGILREAEWLYNNRADLRAFSMLAQDWKHE